MFNYLEQAITNSKSVSDSTSGKKITHCENQLKLFTVFSAKKVCKEKWNIIKSFFPFWQNKGNNKVIEH